jgi:hypothetical protein
VKISSREIAESELSPDTLDAALLELRELGYVTLEAVLPPAWIGKMRTACDAVLEEYVAAQGGAEGIMEKRRGHVGMFAPVRLPFMDPLAIENPFALQIMEAAMGKDLYCVFYNTNTAWPGSGIQGLHRDTAHLFPELSFALPVATVVVNINLVDFTMESGSTEVWPGTHLVVDGPLGYSTYEERAMRHPSVRTHMPAGSVTVRDMRMWHRGMPNHSSFPRTMLALVYNRPIIKDRGTWEPGMKIPRSMWDQMSPRAQHLFRLNRVMDDDAIAATIEGEVSRRAK